MPSCNTSASRFIKAQFYNSDGTPAGAELTLVSATAMVNPAVTGLAGGGFVVTWQEFRHPRAGFRPEWCCGRAGV